MRRDVMLAGSTVLLLALALAVGCTGDNAEATVCAGCSAEMDAKDAVMVGDAMMCSACAAKKAEEPVLARHDCAGDCGMKDWPEDQMTERDGKWYCKGCAAQLPAVEDDHDHEGHEGHDHG